VPPASPIERFLRSAEGPVCVAVVVGVVVGVPRATGLPARAEAYPAFIVFAFTVEVGEVVVDVLVGVVVGVAVFDAL
jgi:hypothetical protein